jgi:hypothetical protein
MRFPISMAALIGACLLATAAHAAPVGAIKDFTLPPQFGDSAPIIKVQRANPGANFQPAPGHAAPARGGQRAGGGQPQGGARQFNGGGGQRHGGGGDRGGHRGGGGGGDNGAGLAAAGLFGGLLLGAIIANESQRNECSRRPGYDPRSQTFVAPDHRRYRCP